MIYVCINILEHIKEHHKIDLSYRSSEEIENKFYLTEEDICYYFSDFVIEICVENRVMKYGNEKRTFEFMIRKQ